MKRLPVVAALLVLCSSSAAFAYSFAGIDFNPPCDVEPKGEASKNPNIEEMFAHALEFERQERWCDAAKLYADIRRHNPISPLLQQSHYNLIQSLFKDGEYDRAITQAKEYLWLYPARTEAEEVLYIMGVCFYSDRGTPDTDQDWTEKAQIVFSDYLRKYPNGQFAEKAREMIEGSYNELARKELNIANFYLVRKHYLASALRAQGMLQRFRASTYVPEGLYLLVRAFIGLERTKDIDAAVRLLEKVYPASEWTEKAKAAVEESKKPKEEKK